MLRSKIASATRYNPYDGLYLDFNNPLRERLRDRIQSRVRRLEAPPRNHLRRRRGELHAAMDAFREAKHLDFVYQHRKALVEAGGLGDAPPPPEVIARRRLEAAHARLDAISEPLS